MNEWNVAALLVEKFGLPGAVLVMLAWAMYRFGATPSQQPAMTNETAAAIAKLADKIDAHHATAEAQRDDVSRALHSLDNRMVRIETTLDHINK